MKLSIFKIEMVHKLKYSKYLLILDNKKNIKNGVRM